MAAPLPPDPLPLQVEVLPTTPDGHLAITIAGEIDMDTGRRLQRAITDALDHHRPQRLSLDMGQATFLSSAGIWALLDCHRHAEQLGCALEISKAHDNVRQVLAISGLLDIFHL
ncbi:STAS domain-containing protein [Actinoplanes sp. KI2]|uniref:STAS domain-containing protein n=1 Tax=Actinoplanes sp. KI2 TaxID=2983315 RepID=UPI0021D5D40C|nr:STAS domain-containing protein [Actinoplanes sp. KI2]MCU7727087.1 STAS domain-containing protein [Actinoplanes sp. KI2]